jgi:hypothetical protein
MKQFLIGSFVLALLLGAAPVMADSNHHRGYSDGNVKPTHYRDHDDYRGGHRSHGHDRRSGDWHGHHPGRHHGWNAGWKKGFKHGWRKGKRHGWKHDDHGDKRSWEKHHHDRNRDHGYRYRLHYNGLLGAGVSGGHVTIDLSGR